MRHRLGAYGVVAAVVLATTFMSRGSAPSQKAPDDWRAAAQAAAAGPPAALRGRVEVAWKEVPAPDVELKPSSFECTDDDRVHQSCMFYNLILYRGDLTYLVKDSRAEALLQLPDPEIFEVGNSPTNSFSLPSLMKVATLSAARRELAAAAASAPQRGGARAPFHVATFETAVFQRTRTFNNWFWALNGAANAYHRLCARLGACSAAQVAAAALLQPIIQSSRDLDGVGFVGLPAHHSFAARDLMGCFGPLFWVNHPEGRADEGRPPLQVVSLRRVLVGVGPDVVQPKAALSAQGEVRYAQANASASLQRVRFLRQCAGLPAEPPPAPARPSVLLINRPYSDGRSILGLDDVADRLARALGPAVPIRLYLPRGEAGLAEQAAVFAAATVVVSPHGAATANFNFLPHDAVALGVFALRGRFGHDEAVGASLPAPPYNVTVLPVDCTGRTEARTEAASSLPRFQELDAAGQAELLTRQEMTTALGRVVRQALGISMLDWMEYRSYLPDPQELTDQVLAAIELWEAKVRARGERARGQRRRRRRRS